MAARSTALSVTRGSFVTPPATRQPQLHRLADAGILAVHKPHSTVGIGPVATTFSILAARLALNAGPGLRRFWAGRLACGASLVCLVFGFALMGFLLACRLPGVGRGRDAGRCAAITATPDRLVRVDPCMGPVAVCLRGLEAWARLDFRLVVLGRLGGRVNRLVPILVMACSASATRRRWAASAVWASAATRLALRAPAGFLALFCKATCISVAAWSARTAR